MKHIHLTVALLLVTFVGGSFAIARTDPAQTKTTTSKQANRLALASENAKRIMLLMDADKNGKISKAEWMKFMSEEFDRLDTNKNGSLDLHELQKSDITVRHISPEIQGK